MATGAITRTRARSPLYGSAAALNCPAMLAQPPVRKATPKPKRDLFIFVLTYRFNKIYQSFEPPY
jgi:hypothetical protein